MYYFVNFFCREWSQGKLTNMQCNKKITSKQKKKYNFLAFEQNIIINLLITILKTQTILAIRYMDM